MKFELVSWALLGLPLIEAVSDPDDDSALGHPRVELAVGVIGVDVAPAGIESPPGFDPVAERTQHLIVEVRAGSPAASVTLNRRGEFARDRNLDPCADKWVHPVDRLAQALAICGRCKREVCSQVPVTKSRQAVDLNAPVVDYAIADFGRKRDRAVVRLRQDHRWRVEQAVAALYLDRRPQNVATDREPPVLQAHKLLDSRFGARQQINRTRLEADLVAKGTNGSVDTLEPEIRGGVDLPAAGRTGGRRLGHCIRWKDCFCVG